MGVRDGSGCLPIIQLVIRIGRIKLHRNPRTGSDTQKGRREGRQDFRSLLCDLLWEGVDSGTNLFELLWLTSGPEAKACNSSYLGG